MLKPKPIFRILLLWHTLLYLGQANPRLQLGKKSFGNPLIQRLFESTLKIDTTERDHTGMYNSGMTVLYKSNRSDIPDLFLLSDSMIPLYAEDDEDDGSLPDGNSTEFTFGILCNGSFPTEVVIDLDMDIIGKNLGWEQWTKRVCTDVGPTTYKAYSKLTYKNGVPRNHNWSCKYTNNDNALTINVTASSENRTSPLVENTQLAKRGGGKRSKCSVRIYIYEDVLEDEVYFKCEGNDSRKFDMSDTFDCLTTDSCNNLYRNAKADTCIVLGKFEDYNSAFNPTLIQPGVFVCWSKTQRGAVQYFFSGVSRGRRRAIHFRWDDIQPDDMISMMLDKQDNYDDEVGYDIGENITASCGVPRYGFSYSPRISFYQDGKLIEEVIGTEQQKRPERIWYLRLERQLMFPGEYTINCSAPVWDSADWATVSKRITVKGASFKDLIEEKILTLDRFLKNDVDETYYAGDNVSLHCQIPKSGVRNDPGLEILRNGMEFKLRGHKGEFGIVNETSDGIMSSFWELAQKIELADSGNYSFQCSVSIAENTSYVKFREVLDLQVKDPIDPYFDSDEETISVHLGETVSENCTAHGSPSPVVSWKPVPIPSVYIRENKLIIPSANELVRGVYTCIARNRFGKEATKLYTIAVTSSGPMGGLVYATIGAVAVLFVLLLLFGAVTWGNLYYRKKKLFRLRGKLLHGFPARETSEYAGRFLSLPLHTKKYRKHLVKEASTLLGDGMFGIVFTSEIIESSGERTVVAAKGLRDKDKHLREIENFVKEIKLHMYILHNLGGHKNVVKFLGTDIDRFLQKEVYLILEYCKNGSLKNYLKKHTLRIKTEELYKWAWEIAQGMVFLSRNNIIHNDIALRNVLLDENDVAKICDFGQARNIVHSDYYRGQLPIATRWTALEALEPTGQKFTTKSDVWSFGVGIWELFSHGDTPKYDGVMNLEDLVHKLEVGERLERPCLADKETYMWMRKCWMADPTERPNFEQLQAYFFKRVNSSNGKRLNTSPCSHTVNATGLNFNMNNEGSRNLTSKIPFHYLELQLHEMESGIRSSSNDCNNSAAGRLNLAELQ